MNGVLSLRPLGAGTRVTTGSDSSELTCGPGSDSDCVSVDRAPADAAFQTGPVAARPAQTYVFRVTGDDNQTHYGKVRVLGTTTMPIHQVMRLSRGAIIELDATEADDAAGLHLAGQEG
mgnify:CR=1 FL=1